MPTVAAYVQYSLLQYEGTGHQPYSQVKQLGMDFEGGVATKDGLYLGYLYGDSTKVSTVIKGLSAWNAIQLSVLEAKYFMESVTPTNTAVSLDGATKYIGAPTTDADGKLTRPILDTATGTPQAYVEHRTATLYVQDDFLSGNTSSGTVGGLSWTTNAGATTLITSLTSGRAGIVARATSNTANTVATMSLPHRFSPTDLYSALWIIRLAQTDANTVIRLGFSDTTTAAQPANGIYCERLGADANWFGVSRAANAQARVNMNTPVTTNFVKIYQRRINSTTVGFKIDNSTEVTLNTNIPAVSLSPWLVITNTASGIKLVELDYFDLKIEGLPR